MPVSLLTASHLKPIFGASTLDDPHRKYKQLPAAKDKKAHDVYKRNYVT